MSDQLHGFGVIAAVEKHCEAICFFGAHTKQDAYCTYGLEKESFVGSGQMGPRNFQGNLYRLVNIIIWPDWLVVVWRLTNYPSE